MSRTATREELLQSCLQDLHAARLESGTRLPCLAAEAGETLSVQVEDLRRALEHEATALAGTGMLAPGPANLWMSGILDDAERDTRSIEPGPLLDTALIGAIRKGVAADAVSLETAVAVARSLGNGAVAELAMEMRERCRSSDDALRGLLVQIA